MQILDHPYCLRLLACLTPEDQGDRHCYTSSSAAKGPRCSSGAGTTTALFRLIVHRHPPSPTISLLHPPSFRGQCQPEIHIPTKLNMAHVGLAWSCNRAAEWGVLEESTLRGSVYIYCKTPPPAEHENENTTARAPIAHETMEMGKH